MIQTLFNCVKKPSLISKQTPSLKTTLFVLIIISLSFSAQSISGAYFPLFSLFTYICLIGGYELIQSIAIDVCAQFIKHPSNTLLLFKRFIFSLIPTLLFLPLFLLSLNWSNQIGWLLSLSKVAIIISVLILKISAIKATYHTTTAKSIFLFFLPFIAMITLFLLFILLAAVQI